MGPYCNYCQRRCFVPRVLKDGRSLIMATCTAGMEHDREATGEDHTTAINPVAAAIVDLINDRYEDANLTPADLVYRAGAGWTVDGMDPDQWAEAMYGDGDE